MTNVADGRREPYSVAAQPPPTSTEAVARGVARHSTIMVAGRAYGRGARLLAQILLGQLLGVAGFGLFVLGRSVVDIGRTLAVLGLDRGALRFIAVRRAAGDPGAVRSTAARALLWAMIASAVVSSALYLMPGALAAVFGEPSFAPLVPLFALGLPLAVVSAVASGILRGHSRIGWDVAVQEILHPSVHLMLVAAFALSATGLTVRGAISAWNLCLLVTAVAALYMVRSTHRGMTRAPEAARVASGELVTYSLSLLFIELGAVVLSRADKLLLGSMATVEVVGLYGAAFMLSTQNVFFLQAVNAAFAPRVAALHSQRRIDELQEVLKLLNRWTMLAATPLLLICTLLAGDMMLLMGPDFAAGAGILMILSLGKAVSAGTGSVGVLLNMSGKHRLELFNTAANLVLLPVLAFPLAVWLGPLGLAAAVAASIAVVNIARLTEVYITLRIHPFGMGQERILIGAAVTVMGWLLVEPLFPDAGLLRLVLGSVFLTSLSAICYLTFIKREDDQYLWRWLARRRIGG